MTQGSGALTIVMYHYVRPIAGSAHPGIRGLELDAFRGQLAHLRRHYSPVSMEDVVAAAAGAPLPARPVLLTFDDGYADHARHVLPVLAAAGVRGAFYPVTSTVFERRVLDVNKVHFVLACGPSPDELVSAVDAAIADAGPRPDVLPIEAYKAEHLVPNRFDPAEVIYVKRLLQHALPADLRSRIADDLFRAHVTGDESSFADDLYLSPEDVGRLLDAGMHVGSHGHRHMWLDRLAPEEQAADIDASLALLASVGVPSRGFTFCYPYGGFTDATTSLLAERGCAAALTTEVGIAPLPLDDVLRLPRLDTNDLPTEPDAEPVTWTARADPT